MSHVEESILKRAILRSSIQTMAEFPLLRKRYPIIIIPVVWTLEYAGNQLNTPGVNSPGAYATGIAVDATGNMHVAYWDYLPGNLM